MGGKREKLNRNRLTSNGLKNPEATDLNLYSFGIIGSLVNKHFEENIGCRLEEK